MKPRPALPAIASLYTQQRSDESVLHLLSFWATVCKTVRPMLSDRCLSVLSVCLSVSLVYCGQTVGWINMPPGMKIGVGPGYIVLDGDPAPPPLKGHSTPNFRPMSDVAKRLDGSRCQLVYGRMSRPRRHCVIDGNPAPQKRHSTPLIAAHVSAHVY